MTSGSHLSKELLDLVKSIGESRSKQEEDRIISGEASLLKLKFAEPKLSEKKLKELLIRAIYVEMLGHDASFSHIYAVNLTQSKNLLVKRIGYLAASLFIDENAEMIILMISTMQKDLQSRNHLEVIAALNCLSKLSNANVVAAVSELVTGLLDHTHEMIRKKAVMVLMKFNKIQPIEGFDVKMQKALCDKDPGVMACALNYFQEEVRKNPSQYVSLLQTFTIILKQIIDHRLPRDYDYHRIPAPWIQTKLLEVLSYLGQNNEETSKQMYEFITTVLKRSDDAASNVGYALVYQSLRCICRIYPSQELIDLATLTISRFLSSSSKNLKYMGIVGLIQIVKIDPKYTLEYQNMVVDCLEDVDETLKTRTLELLFRMTNKQNVEPIVEKLLNYLKAAPIESTVRKDLVIKINELGEKFAPTKQWYIRTMNKVFEMGGDLITQHITNKFIQSIAEYQRMEDGEAFRDATIKIYLKVLKKNPSIPESLMQVIAWIMGEYAADIPDQEKVQSIIEELCGQAIIGFESDITVGLIVSALGKLHLAQGFPPNPIIERIMRDLCNSKHLNVQQRCHEYQALKQCYSQLPGGGVDLYKGTPMNEEQLAMENMDLDLTFLSGYVQEQQAAGAPVYDPSKSLLIANMGATSTVAELNFKAYKQEEVVFSSIKTEKETTAGNPVFNTGAQQTSGDAALRLNNVKSVWGQSGMNEQAASEAAKEEKKGPTFNKPGLTSTTQQKKKIEAPIDKKKEDMKNALFSGISSSKKEDSDSDEKKEEAAEAPIGEMDLLALDDTPSTSTGGGNLLDVAPSNLLDQPPAAANLLDSVSSQPAPMDVNQQLNNILGGFDQPAAPVQPPQPQIMFQGIAGFNTQAFGQAWMQLSNPAAEQKCEMPCPMAISSQAAPQQPIAYGELLGKRTGIQKVEVINNEVIAAGQSLLNAQIAVLVHCRVTPAKLEFTVRSPTPEASSELLNLLKAAFV